MGRSFRRVARVVNMGGQQSNAPAILATEYRNEPFVRHGRHNLFNEFISALRDNVPAVNTSVDTFAQYIAGLGLEFLDKDGKEIPAAMDKWRDLMSHGTSVEDGEDYFLNAVAKDIALVGYAAMEVISGGDGKPAAIHHLDASRLRSGKKDAAGIIQNHYWCSNWELYAKRSKDYPLVTLPSWEAPGFQPKRVLVYKGYHQGIDFLGLPWWLPAITNAEVLSRIPVFNRTQLDTGFRPSFHIHVFTNKDETDLIELDENIEAIFTGQDGKSYAVTTGTPQEGAPVFNKLERGDHAGELGGLEDKYEQIIYKAFGIPPILMGVDVNTGMSGKGLAIEQTLTLFQRTKIAPFQKYITNPAKRAVELCGIPVHECRVKQLTPFDAATDAALKRQSYLRSVFVWEDRMTSGLPIATVDGKDPNPNRSNWDPRMNLLLIEAGSAQANTNEEQDANKDTNKDESNA